MSASGPPLCRICQKEHWMRDPHILPANAPAEKRSTRNTSARVGEAPKGGERRPGRSGDCSSSRLTAQAGGTPAKNIPSSGLNVHVSSVSPAKSQPETGKLGKQQRINCGRDSRRDGKNTQREGRRVLKAEAARPDATRTAATAKPNPPTPRAQSKAQDQTKADKVTPGKRKTAPKKKATKKGKK